MQVSKPRLHVEADLHARRRRRPRSPCPRRGSCRRSLALAHEPMSSSSSQWMTSARMKPRCRSVWMTPGALGGLGAGPERPRPALLLAGGEEGAQAEQVVGGADHAGQRALAEAEGLEHLGPLVVGELDGLGLELHAHAEHLAVAPRPSSAAHRGLELGDARRARPRRRSPRPAPACW